MNRKMREILEEMQEVDNKLNEVKVEAEKLLAINKVEEGKVKVVEVKDLRKKYDDLREEFQIESEKFEEEKQTLNNLIGGNNMDTRNLKIIKNAIYPNEKLFSSKNKYENKDIDLGKLVRGMSGRGWDNAANEQEYYNMTASGNEVIIPKNLSDQILDVARSKSALFGKIPIVKLENNNLTVAIQTKDAEANFIAEGDLIPASDLMFTSVDLKGKTLAMYINVTDQLLDSTNLEEQLTQSVANAIVNALDTALLYGTGDKSIKGLESLEGVEKITHTTSDTNYDFIVAGTKAIKKANLVPTHIAYNSDLASDLEIAKTKDGKYLEKPQFMNNYDISESNNIKENQAVIYDVNSLLLGINKDITISWGYSTDDFQRLKKGLRVHLRADMTPVRNNGVKIVNITKQG